MKTVFKKGMKVYDSFNFPGMEGLVIKINEDTSKNYPVFVDFKGENRENKIQSYTIEGKYTINSIPTLSTKPYQIELQNFEQKAPVPTYEEAEEWIRKEYEKGNNYLMSKDILEALRKLVILRDYYNEGWQPDWSNKNRIHFCIRVRNNKITIDNNSDINEFNTVLVFRDYTIRDKFLEEQRELLEIAKPLL